MLTLTPHDELDSTVWFLISSTMWKDPEVLQREYTQRITAIFEEDRAIVLSQRPELLPRIVFATGDVLRQETTRFLEGIPNLILLKPLDLGNVRRALADALGSGV